MPTRYLWIVFCFLVTGLQPAFAERIHGPANIRETPSGKILFTLNDSVLVSAAPMRDGWFQIGIFVRLKTYEKFPEPETEVMKEIKKGSILFDMKKKEIGITTDIVLPKDIGFTSEQGKRVLEAHISGYTHQDNIRKDSIVEENLERILDNSKRPVLLSTLRTHLKAFEYHHSTLPIGFESYMCHEYSLDDPSPGPRIILIVQEQNLVAIISSRSLFVEHIGSAPPILDRYDLIYLQDMPAEDKTQLEHYYLNRFRYSD